MDSQASTSVPVSEIEPFHYATGFRRRRPLFWLTLALCCGIFADAVLAPALASAGGVFLAALFAAAALASLSPLSNLNAGRSLRFFACAMCVAIAGGMLLHALRVRVPAAADISRQTSAMPSFVVLRGTILEVARAREGGAAHWTLSVEAQGSDASVLVPASGRVRVALSEAEDVQPRIGEGDRVSFRARLEAPPEVTVPGAFDFGAYLAHSGISRVGAVFPGSIERSAGPAWWRPDLRLRRFSTTLAERVEALLPGKEGQAALLSALLFGRRERLDESDRESFAISGAAHLLAISGLQIQFLAYVLWRGAAMLGFTRRRSALFIILISMAYCALAGADVPIVRATVMIALYLAATVLYRQPDPLNTLGASALLILFAAPAELFTAGFQLSFLAVLALITIYPALEEGWTAWRRQSLPPVLAPPEVSASPSIFGKLLTASRITMVRRAVFMSFAAWIGTAPVVAWHMGRFSTLSLFINIIAVPLGSACMISGTLMLALSLVSTALALFAGTFSYWLLLILQELNAVIAAIPFSSIDLPPPALPVVAVYASVLLWIWIERQRSAGFGRTCAMLISCAVLLNTSLFFRETPSAPSVTVLDLRSGRAALIESPSGGAAMIDAGGFGTGMRIAEMLRRRGISRLALLVISADEPDAIDGALELLKHVPAARIILPRDSSPSQARRELERYLAGRDIPYATPDPAQVLQGPGSVRWEFTDDGRAADSPAGAQTAIAVRVSLPGTRVLFVNARSDAALQRLLSKRGVDGFTADILRLSSGPGGRWPSEVTRLVRGSGCRALIAGSGSDPEDGSGVDLAALAEAHGLRLYSPNREGSLRVQADTGGSARSLHAFRGGEWKELP